MRPAGEAHARGLEAALVDFGAPPDLAFTLARQATLEDSEGTLMLCFNGHCTELMDEPDDGAYELLALNAAADNAEAYDRQQRGEVGWVPMWPLKDRRPRG
jgi:hypothetical protein